MVYQFKICFVLFLSLLGCSKSHKTRLGARS